MSYRQLESNLVIKPTSPGPVPRRDAMEREGPLPRPASGEGRWNPRMTPSPGVSPSAPPKPADLARAGLPATWARPPNPHQSSTAAEQAGSGLHDLERIHPAGPTTARPGQPSWAVHRRAKANCDGRPAYSPRGLGPSSHQTRHPTKGAATRPHTALALRRARAHPRVDGGAWRAEEMSEPLPPRNPVQTWNRTSSPRTGRGRPAGCDPGRGAPPPEHGPLPANLAPAAGRREDPVPAAHCDPAAR